MAKDPPQPYTGPVSIDLTADAALLIDLPPGGTQRLRREQDGIEGVLEELELAVPKHGGAAGITPELYSRFKTCTEELAKIRAARHAVDKLAEVLRESEAYKEDIREGFLSMMCKAVKSAAQHDAPSVVAPFEKTLKYNAQRAEKAVKTRRRNAEGNEGDESAENDAPSPAGTSSAHPE
jgi:hypothetical protein